LRSGAGDATPRSRPTFALLPLIVQTSGTISRAEIVLVLIQFK
jgi:hypothetical protein